MAYRSGTYVAFHAAGTSSPIASDIRYYRMLLAWHNNDGINFRLIDSHEKAGVRDSSSKARLQVVLKERLKNSRNMILVVTSSTRLDTDWVPFEIGYAIDTCEIPIIAAYPDYDSILAPAQLAGLWPTALAERIRNGSAHVIHVPFKREPLNAAIGQFSHEAFPLGGGLGYYSREAYASFGITIPGA